MKAQSVTINSHKDYDDVSGFCESVEHFSQITTFFPPVTGKRSWVWLSVFRQAG
jgi:hypothetical protein